MRCDKIPRSWMVYHHMILSWKKNGGRVIAGHQVSPTLVVLDVYYPKDLLLMLLNTSNIILRQWLEYPGLGTGAQLPMFHDSKGYIKIHDVVDMACSRWWCIPSSTLSMHSTTMQTWRLYNSADGDGAAIDPHFATQKEKAKYLKAQNYVVVFSYHRWFVLTQ